MLLLVETFATFVHERYGSDIVHLLERMDLGKEASVGGSEVGEPRFEGQPVIIVHGITNKISRFNGIIRELHKHGNKNGVFGTTWGDAGVTPVGLVEMKCSYVKQLRQLIIAVYEYIGQKVDIIAYSMGSPLLFWEVYASTVAKLLVPPLTELIDTFLSVAGSNSGSSLCFVPIPVGTCNKRNGLHCDSEFLNDINSQTRYEGEHIFSIFSTHDDKVGYRTCGGKLTSPILKEDGYVKKSHLNHDQVMDSTHKIQINLIQKHMP
ncbi:hypothetical protein M3Y97_00534000 [Aphelenchoides bicaudatus]|nr:hypothetical protein M3Y97_00534000 [Aphelenchoides bicaudatus]